MVKFYYKSMLLLLVAFMICGSVATNTFAQAALKIGFIDLQRVIDNSEEGKRAQEDIKKRADELSLKAEQMKNEIATMKAEYEKQKSLLTVEARTEKLDSISKMELEYSRFAKDSETEIRTAQQRALKQLLEDLGKLVAEYGKANDFSLILEAGNILYGAESIDITDDIIQFYNTKRQ